MDGDESVKISSNSSEENIELAVLLIQQSYWGNERSRETIFKSFENSLCFYLTKNEKIIGFSRVISDFATFSYLCDVVVVDEHRGLGFSKYMLESILNHPELLNTKWLLRTKDAHGLYEKFGFNKTDRPNRYMEK